jgi:hypothetical protein
MRIWPMALALLTLTAFTPLSAQDWEAGLLVANQTYPSLNTSTFSGTDLVAAMAPRFQAGIYLGVNF